MDPTTMLTRGAERALVSLGRRSQNWGPLTCWAGPRSKVGVGEQEVLAQRRVLHRESKGEKRGKRKNEGQNYPQRVSKANWESRSWLKEEEERRKKRKRPVAQAWAELAVSP